MWTEVLIVILVLILLVASVFFVYKYVGGSDDKLTDLVDEINRSALYAYKFDKTQDQNVKILDDNIKLMHQNYNALQESVDFALSEVKALDNMKNEISTERLNVRDLQVMDYAFSDKAPADASGSNWLYLYNGGTFSSGLSMDKAQANTMYVGDKIVVGNSWVLATPSKKSLHIGSNMAVSQDGVVSLNGLCTSNMCLKEDADGELVVCPKNTPDECRKI